MARSGLGAACLNCFQEALTSLSAPLVNSLSIFNHLRRWLDHFKPSAYFLHLRGLLSEAGGQRLNLRFLQGNPGRLFFSRGIQLLHELLLLEQVVHRKRRTRRRSAEFAIAIDQDRYATRRCRAGDTGDIAIRDMRRVADADGAVFATASRTRGGTDINIIVTIDAGACSRLPADDCTV